MNAAQLAKLDLKDLLSLQNKVAAAMDTRRSVERDQVKAKIAKLAAESGFDLNELLGNKRGAAKGTKIAPKYANPKDPTQTWTGRGRKPLWLTAELKRGKKITSFAI